MCIIFRRCPAYCPALLLLNILTTSTNPKLSITSIFDTSSGNASSHTSMALTVESLRPGNLSGPVTENILSLLALISLLAFFYNAFDRMIQPSREKAGESRLSYGTAMAV